MFLSRILLMLAFTLVVLQPAGASDEYLWFDLKPTLFRGLNEEQIEMLKGADDPGGPITEEMHRQFWALFSLPDRKDWIEAERSGTPRSETILLREHLNVAFLRSAYETRATGKAVRAPELDALRQRILSLGPRNPDQWQSTFAMQDKWLDPAFEPSPKLLWRYPSRMFESLNEAEMQLRRRQMLLQSTWDDTSRTWSYPPTHLQLNWAHPWRMMPPMFCHDDCKAWSIGQPMGVASGVELWYFDDVKSGDRLLESQDYRVALNFMTDLMITYEVISQSSTEAEWQGHRSVTFESSVKLYNGKLSYRVVRVVFSGEGTTAWLLVAASATSLADAEAAFDRLEAAVDLR